MRLRSSGAPLDGASIAAPIPIGAPVGNSNALALSNSGSVPVTHASRPNEAELRRSVVL